MGEHLIKVLDFTSPFLIIHNYMRIENTTVFWGGRYIVF